MVFVIFLEKMESDIIKKNGSYHGPNALGISCQKELRSDRKAKIGGKGLQSYCSKKSKRKVARLRNVLTVKHGGRKSACEV